MITNPKDITAKDLLKLSTKDLLAVYNAHAEKPIERFADHPSALRRTKELLDSLGKGITKTVPAKPHPIDGKKARSKVIVAPVDKPASTTEYHSVLAAFKALNLPIEKHQRFRRTVKVNGKATFGEFVFTAVYK